MEVSVEGRMLKLTFKENTPEEFSERVDMDKIADISTLFGTNEHKTIASVNLALVSLGTCYPQTITIRLENVTNQASWTPDVAGVKTAAEDIASWKSSAT